MKRLLLILLAFGLFVACEDSDPLTDSGNKLLPDYGEIHRDTLYAVADTFLVKGKIDNGFGTKLLLGSYNGFEARPLMKFFYFPADTFILDTVKVLLYSDSRYGDGQTEITGNAYLVTEDWEKDVNANEDWIYQNNIDMSGLTSVPFTLQPGDTMEYALVLPDTLVKVWRDTTGGGQNYGLLLDFDMADHIIEFSSAEIITGPKLVTMYHARGSDSVLSDTVYAGSDAYLLDYTGTFDTDKRYVVSGYTVHSFFQFELDRIPQTAQIVHADFYFQIDSVNSVLNEDKVNTMYVRDVTTDFSLLRQGVYEIDSSFARSLDYSVPLSEQKPKVLALAAEEQPDVAKYFLQSLVNGTIDYGSFYLQFTNEYDEVSLMVIEGVRDNNPPYLIVEYFDTPKTRL
jgi:hypothetical protein